MENTQATAIIEENELGEASVDVALTNHEPANANRRQPTTALALVKTISHVKSVDDFEREISGAWHRALSSIIDVGKLCAEAASALDRADLNDLKSRLTMSDATFTKLVKIAQDQRIADPENQLRLPCSYGTLYELTHLSDDEFEAAIGDGSINPDMQRNDAAALRPSSSSDATSQTSSQPKKAVLLKIVAVDDDVSDDDFKELQNLVSELAGCSSIGLELSPKFKSIRDRLSPSH
jgi:hypothetical protein